MPSPEPPESRREAFATEQLDSLMERAGVDALIATSRHNVRYMLGDQPELVRRFDQFGVDGVLAAVGYVRGRIDQAFVIVRPAAHGDLARHQMWTPTVQSVGGNMVDTGRAVAGLLKARNQAAVTLGIETASAPDAFVRELRRTLPRATLVDAADLVAELRAVKRPDELALIKAASERIVAAVLASVRVAIPGMTTRQVQERVAAEQNDRGVDFEFCLIATGTDMSRAPSSTPWEKGAILSVDSGGTLDGYLGDLARVAVLGDPTPRMREVLAEVELVQQTARGLIRPGVTGREVFEAALAARSALPDAAATTFVAHGIGLTREPPYLASPPPPPYGAPYWDQPLKAGMVLSVETDIKAADVGFIKLEDTVAVVDGGHEAYGDEHRDWIAIPC